MGCMSRNFALPIERPPGSKPWPRTKSASSRPQSVATTGFRALEERNLGQVEPLHRRQIRAPNSGAYLVERNPRTRGESFSVARGDAVDVDAAVQAATAALPAWRGRKPIERGRILWAIAQKMRERSADLVKIESLETGKPAAQTAGDIEGSAQYFEFYASVVNAQGGDTIDLGPNYHSYTRREPFGVVGIILPWNGRSIRRRVVLRRRSRRETRSSRSRANSRRLV